MGIVLIDLYTVHRALHANCVEINRSFRNVDVTYVKRIIQDIRSQLGISSELSPQGKLDKSKKVLTLHSQKPTQNYLGAF